MSEARDKLAIVPIWWAGALLVAALCAVGWFLIPRGGIPKAHTNERAAIGALKRAGAAEEILKADDRDGNGAQEYWTGDWSGLFRLADKSGNPVALIDTGAARADSEPLPESRSGPPSLSAPLPRTPYAGYWFRMLRRKDGEDLQRDGPDADAQAWEHPAKYAFVAWPAEHGKTGFRTFIACEDGQVWSKDLGVGGGETLREWPGGDLKSLGWVAE